MKDTINYVAMAADLSTPHITIEGTVMDEDGLPIVGAIAKVSDSYKGTVTDFDGHFALTIPRDATLDVMYIGARTESFSELADRSNLKITLHKE